jgi:NitT/TauT family transport system permease protein
MARLPAARSWMLTLALLGAIVFVWQVASSRGLISTFLLPSPLQIARSFPRLITEEGLLERIAISARELLLAASIAIFAGSVLGWMLHRSQTGWLAFNGWITAFNAAPLIMLYPLFLLVFGRGTLTVVVLGVLGALPPIILKSREAFALTPRVLSDVGRSFNLAPIRQFWLILLPAALPTLVTGIRLGVFYALISVIGAEFLMGIGGLGALIPDLADRYRLPDMYAAILTVILTSAVFLAVVRRAERALRKA